LKAKMMSTPELIPVGGALSGFLFRDINVKPACLIPLLPW